MFGYLNIEKAKLQEDKQGVWQTFMCGMCFSTKKQFGNIPRLLISNDVNFFNVLFHAATDTDVQVEQRRCFSSPFKKRSVLQQTELIDKMSVANVLLTYWNLYDDVVDGGSAQKKAALRFIKKAYRKAQTLMPDLDKMLSERYLQLRNMEQLGVRSIDRVSHEFAQLSAQFAVCVLGEKAGEHLQTLCYNLGKWIYLIDALDDAEKDEKKGNFNPFLACYGVTAQRLCEKKDELQFLMFAVLNRVAMAYNDLGLEKYACILNNVLYDSIRDKTKQILARYDGAATSSAKRNERPPTDKQAENTEKL